MKRFLHKIARMIDNSKGFTLLESVISMAVFSIGILGMAALQTTAIRSNTLAEKVQENTAIGMSQIEELMAADFLDKRIANDGAGSETINNRYTITWDVLNNLAIPGAKKVVVTAKFKEQGQDKTITLKIFKPRIN